MSFESDLARIEEIVAQLDSDQLELDRALTLFEEGIERLRTAAAALSVAEGKVKLLVERSDGGFVLPELGD